MLFLYSNPLFCFLFPPSICITGGLTLDQLNRTLRPIIEVIPILINQVRAISAVSNNLWTQSKVSNSTAGRSGNYRQQLMKKLKYNNDSNLPVCMVSGMSGNGFQVVCAHIAPCSSKEHLLAKVGLTKDDTGSTRNGLFLSKGFELAFDRLQLSFIRDPKNPLDSSLYLKIWDDSCRSHELWAGCDDATIGEYDGWKLNLNGHEPFKRALSYQAYQAYSNCPAS